MSYVNLREIWNSTSLDYPEDVLSDLNDRAKKAAISEHISKYLDCDDKDIETILRRLKLLGVNNIEDAIEHTDEN
jgi:hypothetical protein